MTKRTRWIIAVAGVVTVAVGLHRCGDDDRTADAPSSSTPTARRHAATGKAPRVDTAGSSIAGTIRDGRGPLAGATVCANGTEWTTPARCATSDARGAYAIAVSPGRIQIVATARGHLADHHDPTLSLHDGEHLAGVDVTLAEGGAELHGRVTDEAGLPIAHAHVTVEPFAVDTDDAGRYSLWLAPGWATIRATATRYATTDRYGAVPGVADIVMRRGATIAGTVVDAEGQPVAGAVVTTSHSDATHDNTIADTPLLVTDADGRFSADGLVAGRYEITARATHGAGRSPLVVLSVGHDVADVVVELAPGFEVAARIATPTGICSDGWLWLEDSRGRTIAATRDPDGVQHVGGLAPGRYGVSLFCPDFQARTSYDPVDVRDRDVEITCPVADGGSVRGRVATRSGHPIAAVDVDAVGITDRRHVGSSKTRPDGTFEIHGLAPGRYELRSSGYASTPTPSTISSAFEIRATETVARDLVADDNAGGISGTVVDESGKPVRDATVRIHLASSDDQSYIANLDDAGQFTVEGFPPETYKLEPAVDDGMLVVRDPRSAIVRVTAGETAHPHVIVTAPQGTIRGRVVDASGAPVADAVVSVKDQVGAHEFHWERHVEVATDGDGRFVATALMGESPYQIRAYRREGVEVTQHDVHVGADVTLTLPAPATIAGIAHRAAGATGDLAVQVYDKADGALVRSQTFPGGAFELTDMAPGTYNVAIAADGSQTTTEVSVTAGARASVDVSLLELVTITGRVVDARTDRPVAGLLMSAGRPDNTASNRTAPGGGGDVTGADGRFTLTNVPQGRVTVSGAAEGYGRVEVTRLTGSGPVSDLGDIPAGLAQGESTGSLDITIAVVGDDLDARVATVVDVAPRSDAAHDNILPGDVIVSIDGVIVTGREAERAPMLLDGPSGSTVRIEIERGLGTTLVRH